MPNTFRFSPRTNRAHEIRWREWGATAFEEAARADRPVLLNLTAVWCHWCHWMDETTYSDAGLIGLINDELVPVRVDADRYPHVQDRYIAGGWPTNAFLTPGGEVLWAGTYVAPEQFRAVAGGVLRAWRERRSELRLEIERRRKAMDAARSRKPAVGLVRRSAADDVWTALEDGFDPRNGGFGGAPKFPCPDAIELLFTKAARTGAGAAGPGELAARTLDGMLAGELWDPVDGGFFRYAAEADWTRPHHEKLLEANAGLLRAYALGARLTGRADWRETAERTVSWVESTLRQPDGSWGGSQDADEAYYASDADGRRAGPRPYVDPVVYVSAAAQWIRALADAGGRLDRPDWIDRAAGALDALLDAAAAPDGLLYHCLAPGEPPAVPGLLVDALEAARACVAVAQATGSAAPLERGMRLADALERWLWAAEGGFLDHVSSGADIGALRYRDRPFEANASAARLFLDLAHATGERSYRAVAERTLAVLCPLAGRYGVAAAEFALAVDEYFEPPARIFVVGPPAAAAPLRRAALALAEPARRVWSLEAGGRIGTVAFPATPAPAAYACAAGACSPPVERPERLAAALDAVR